MSLQKISPKHALRTLLIPAIILMGAGCCKKFDDLADNPDKKTPPPPAYKPHITGNYLNFISENQSPTEETLGGADLNVLVLKDNVVLPLNVVSGSPDEGIIDRNHVTVKDHVYERFAVSGNKYRATKFGAIKLPNQEAIVFAQGYPTEVMPEKGVATYLGDSALHLPSRNFEGKGIFAAIVNFSEKRLSIEVDTVDGIESYPIAFKANIRGNTFSSDDKSVISQGGFYGHAAEEMSGYFIKGDDVGAFGGKKQ